MCTCEDTKKSQSMSALKWYLEKEVSFLGVLSWCEKEADSATGGKTCGGKWYMCF